MASPLWLAPEQRVLGLVKAKLRRATGLDERQGCKAFSVERGEGHQMRSPTSFEAAGAVDHGDGAEVQSIRACRLG